MSRPAPGRPALPLRPMTEADLDAVLLLEDALFGDEAWTRPMLAAELGKQASRYYLVADDGGAVAGYAGLLAAGRHADVLTLAVAAGRWGRGIGSALLEALTAEARRRGCAELFLEVRTDNQRAQQLYRRRGFEPVGVRRGYYQPSGADALVMRLPLAGLPPGTAATTGGGSGRDGVAGGAGRDGADRGGIGSRAGADATAPPGKRGQARP